MILKLFIIFPTLVFASIFGVDDREEFYELDPQIAHLSQASVALVLKSNLVDEGEKYLIKAQSLRENLDFCSDSNYSQQKMLANCSGSLIKNGHIVTAAHCFNDEYPTKNYYVVFNYKNTSKNETLKYINKEDVFEIKKSIYNEFTYSALDLAVFKLDRIPKYKPLTISKAKLRVSDKIFVMGYPLGIPLKISNDSDVKNINVVNKSFRHELDTFSVNSGSPILNMSHELIGVHVRGTGINYMKYFNDCNDWLAGISGKDFGEANLVYPILNLKFD